MYAVRLMTVVVVAGILLFAFSWASRDTLAALGLDLWELPESARLLEMQDERRARIDESFAVVNERLRAKQQLAEDLAAGRLTVQAAADRLRLVLGAKDGQIWLALNRAEPMSSDDEILFRHLLDITKGVVENKGSPEEKCRLIQLLEAQLPSVMARPPQAVRQAQVPPSRGPHSSRHCRRSGHVRGNRSQVG